MLVPFERVAPQWQLLYFFWGSKIIKILYTVISMPLGVPHWFAKIITVFKPASNRFEAVQPHIYIIWWVNVGHSDKQIAVSFDATSDTEISHCSFNVNYVETLYFVVWIMSKKVSFYPQSQLSSTQLCVYVWVGNRMRNLNSSKAASHLIFCVCTGGAICHA